MPFLDSDTIRPLYDVKEGGPPQAFQCRLDPSPEQLRDRAVGGYTPCLSVTRTIAGMISHQWNSHHVKRQSAINFTDLEAKTE